MQQFTLSLYGEIAACLGAATLIGFLTAWFIQRSRGLRRWSDTEHSWAQKYSELEQEARQDEEHLEERLRSLTDELKALNKKNRALEESLRKNESTVHKARADAIELNRQQAETQERLQRIIQQKDREILELRNEASAIGADSRRSRGLASTTLPLREVSSGNRTRFDDVRGVDRLDLDDTAASTVSLAEVTHDGLDQTLQIDPSQMPSSGADADTGEQWNSERGSAGMASASIDTDFDGASTVALDDEALAQARHSSRRSGTDAD